MNIEELKTLNPQQFISMISGTICLMLAVLFLAKHLFTVASRPLPVQVQSWQYERKRKMKLRENSKLFRWFEPFVNELQPATKRLPVLNSPALRNDVQRSLQQAAGPLPFNVDEFLAFCLFVGIVSTCIIMPIATLYTSAFSAVQLSVLAGMGMVGMSIYALCRSANERMLKIKCRLPFCVDLLALMVEAGATPLDSLATAVEETRGTAVGDEMATVLRHTSANQTLVASLQRMGDRLCDAEINEVVMAITNADRLGTPLSEILLRMADQMRLRRTQNLEKQAGQAQTMMAFPGFIVMLSCLMIVISPFVLAFIKNQPL